MSDRLEDTRPRPVTNPALYRNEIPAPPKFLLFAVIGLFILAIGGVTAGILIFRDVLEPGQQQRIIDQFGFMEVFLPPRPAAGDTLPTLEPRTPSGVNPQDLLNLQIPGVTTSTPAEETSTATEEALATNTVTVEATSVSVLSTTVPTDTPLPTSTPEPTIDASIQPTSTTTGSVVSQSVSYENNALLGGINYQKQTWNNCGPANITMALSFYGWQNDQVYAASYLKPGGKEDKNVNPWELVDFVNTYSQVKALTRIGGNLDLIKTFISNGFPVIIETSEMYEGYDWLGHYRTIVGYNDSSRTLTIDDSFLGQGTIETYEDVDAQWQHFNRRFILVYKPQDETRVAQILGDRADPIKAAQHAFEIAQEEARVDPNNAFAWFNMGTALVMMSDYESAAAAFDKANELRGIPWRMLWYQFGPYEAYYNVGRYTDVIGLAESNLTNGGEYVEETYYWLGKALAGQGKKNEALTAFRDALRRNPDYDNARVALDELNKSA